MSTRAISDLERGVNARPRRHTATALAIGLGLEGDERLAFERHAGSHDEPRRDDVVALPLRALPPLTLDPFVDDGWRVEALLSLIADRRNRVVTLLGPGGIGKTRLVLEAVAHVEGPTAFVPLAPVDDPSLLAATIGDVLGVEHGPMRSHLESVIEHLGGRTLTLVLDNVEQLIDAAVDIAALARSCPGLSVVTTSRIPLRIAGEVRFVVDPFRTGGQALAERADVRLFLARAATTGHGLVDGPEDLIAIGELCARLDGVPLAIELAAARAGIVPPGEMLRHLDQILDLLTVRGGDALVQRRSMRATLEWSFRLLSPPAAEAFSALGVFAASASTDATLAAWGLDRSSMPTYFDLLQELADAHLVTVDRGAPGDVRLDMFDTTRQFAREALHASGGTEIVLERLARWALDVVEQAEHAITGPDQLTWLELLDAEVPNVRALGRRLVEHGREDLLGTSLRLAAGLQRFWDIRSRWGEGAAWLRDGLDRPGGDPAVRAKAHKALGVMHRCLGDLDGAEVELERAVGLYVAARDDLGAASCLNNQGVVALDRATYQRAAGLFRRALDVCDAHGDEQLGALVLNNLGLATIETGDLRNALRLCRRSRDLLAAQGNVSAQSWPEDNLASVLTMAGHPRWAVPIHERTIRRRLSLGDENGFVWSLEALAAAWAELGSVEVAGRALGFVAAHRQRLGALPVPYLEALSTRRRAAVAARVGGPRAEQLWDEGAALPPAVVRAWFAD